MRLPLVWSGMVGATALAVTLIVALTMLSVAHPPEEEKGRTFPGVPIPTLATQNGWVRPRATATGTVSYTKRESDGDFHIRLSDGTSFVVCEIIPELPMANGEPKVGDRIEVWGVHRWDGEHKWGELHPVIGWRKK